MPARFRNIAILIAGIFLFPVAYQPWHMAQHHSHDVHNHEAHGHQCDHPHHQHDHSSAADSEAPIIHTFDHCYICDYEFAVKALPGIVLADQTPVEFEELHAVEASSQYESSVSWRIQPRAPPAG